MRAILDREFFGFARTRRFFLVRMAVFLFPFVLFVGIAWRMSGLPGDFVGVTIHNSTMFATLLAALCVTPGMLAHVVPQERRRNRLEVLRSTPLSARQLVLGKYLSRVGLVTLTVIAALSLPALALLFGGISPGQLLRGGAVVIATVAWTGAVALFTSASRTELGPASRVAYASTALFCILPLIGWSFFGVVMATGRVAPWTFDQLVWIGSCVNPFLALGTGARTAAFGGADPAIGYGVFSAVVTALALRGAIARVRRDPKPVKRPGRTIPVARPDGTRAEMPVPASASARAIDADPLRWLEERRPGLRRRQKRFLATLAGIELLNLVWWAVAGSGVPGNALTAVLALIHAAFLAAIEGATAFRRDEEANTLDVLHATPLGSAEIARAKIAAAGRAWRGWWFLAAIHAVAATLCAGREGVEGLPQLLIGLAIAWLVLEAITGVALRIGLSAPSTPKALVRVFGWGIVILVVAPVFLLFVVQGGGGMAAAILLGWHPLMVATTAFWWLDGPIGSDGRALRIFTLLYLLLYVLLVVSLRRSVIPSAYASIRDGGDR